MYHKKNEISLEKPPITTSKKREFYHVLKLEINSRLLVFVGQFVVHVYKQIDILPSNHKDVCTWKCIYSFPKRKDG